MTQQRHEANTQIHEATISWYRLLLFMHYVDDMLHLVKMAKSFIHIMVCDKLILT